jgi:Mrp family chromosome partitioning ATPase
MARVRKQHGKSVFAVTAPHRRAGSSYVVNLLAGELASRLEATVAVMPAETLKGGDPKHLPQGFVEHSPGVWTAVPDQTLEQMPDFALENVWISPGANNFDFVLLDCPAIDGNSQVMRWTSWADGVLLVVEAGVTRINQIEAAERALETSGSRLEGIILNRRSYPIPNFLYKLL